MKFKLFLLTALSSAVPALAQPAAVSGTVVDATTGAPLPGATISIRNQGITVTTGPAGDFRISTALPGGSDADGRGSGICRKRRPAQTIQ